MTNDDGGERAEGKRHPKTATMSVRADGNATNVSAGRRRMDPDVRRRQEMTSLPVKICLPVALGKSAVRLYSRRP